jgi:hypothetical protein
MYVQKKKELNIHIGIVTLSGPNLTLKGLCNEFSEALRKGTA